MNISTSFNPLKDVDPKNNRLLTLFYVIEVENMN